MKATGIVRRIDDLGRVVIPKEIRRTLRIREGDPLEIYTDKEGTVVFKKYSPVGELTAFSSEYAEAIYKITSKPTAIVDKDCVVAVSGMPKKELIEKEISKDLDEILDDRMTYAYYEEDEEPLPLLEENEKYFCSIVCPIVCEGDAIGAVIIFNSDMPQKSGETEEKIAQTSATVLGRILEN
ncbi:MAG: AbrB/MazE/SpoVT family DNA-binding domain-containing protein [Clostridia bacterium]|nr:AbrB/MazE/SpoVT family DNA-binding domain-containing protein [Clostridia bacterium]